MERSPEPLRSALATLQARWGSAAVRLGDGRPAGSVAAAGDGAQVSSQDGVPTVHGALALAVLPDSHPEGPQRATGEGVISTGFPALDAILGPAGLPAEASVVLRGGPSSGKTTLALRCAAEAQADGDIVAWLDLARAFDPVEAVSRGVDLRWLLVVRPADAQEGLGLAGSLLSGRCVGLLVVDLPGRTRGHLDEGIRRLVAHARRVGARLLVLEPAGMTGSLGATLAGSAGLRLELERRAWLWLGRNVVGQRTMVAVAKNRYGPPGRSVDLDIHYLADGERSPATHGLAPAEVGGQGPAPLRPEPGADLPDVVPLERLGPRLVVV